jgi:hypothetical protein
MELTKQLSLIREESIREDNITEVKQGSIFGPNILLIITYISPTPIPRQLLLTHHYAFISQLLCTYILPLYIFCFPYTFSLSSFSYKFLPIPCRHCHISLSRGIGIFNPPLPPIGGKRGGYFLKYTPLRLRVTSK